MIVECDTCEARVDAKEIGSYDVYEQVDGMVYTYSLLKCVTCSSPVLVIQDNYGHDQVSDPSRLYPASDKSSRVNLPSTLAETYEEALDCFKVKAYTGATLLCRKTLEAMCKEHKVKAKNLALGLKELKDAGVIENRLYDWAEALRISGNNAAHDVDSNITRQDARDILDFTDALLQYVFTFRDKFDEFMQRQKKKVTTPTLP